MKILILALILLLAAAGCYLAKNAVHAMHVAQASQVSA